MADNFSEDVEDIECPPEVHPVEPTSAEKPATKKWGRPITKETAKQYQLSAAAAKRRRKEARVEMLAKLTSSLDLGDELVKAVKSRDESQIRLIEKALQIVGLHYDQSEEGKAQRLDVKSEMSVKKAAAIKVVFTEAKPPLEEVKPES